MAEEVSARRLTGHIQLCPTEAELEALISALVRLRGVARDLRALPRLLALAQEHVRPRPQHEGKRDEGTEQAARAASRGPEGLEDAREHALTRIAALEPPG
ncbi:MAG TPA: hypothetical protein VGJ25_09895 [Gaiellaceae bacterium]|jgi:hypothetical protein